MKQLTLALLFCLPLLLSAQAPSQQPTEAQRAERARVHEEQVRREAEIAKTTQPAPTQPSPTQPAPTQPGPPRQQGMNAATASPVLSDTIWDYFSFIAEQAAPTKENPAPELLVLPVKDNPQLSQREATADRPMQQVVAFLNASERPNPLAALKKLGQQNFRLVNTVPFHFPDGRLRIIYYMERKALMPMGPRGPGGRQ